MKTKNDSVLFTLVRMCVCLIIGLGLVISEGSSLHTSRTLLLISFAAGMCTAGFLSFWLVTLDYHPMVTVDTATSMGSIIPAVLCAVFFGQTILPMKLVGFALIVLASFVLARYRPMTLKQNPFLKWSSLFFTVAGYGFNSFTQQLFNCYCADTPKSVFHFYTYLFAAIALVIILFFMQRCSKEKTSFRLILKPLPLIICLSLSLFVYNYLQTVLVTDYAVPPQILYPTLCGGVVISNSISAMIFFGEKPTRRSILGTLLALGGIVATNIM